MNSVFELRQYTLHPGRRDDLIELFERELIEPQEAAGMHIVAQFRDLGDPDRFVWIRAFPDMVARKESLERFYGGPVWKKFRDQANATMIDSDNVLLLRLVDPRFGFPVGAKTPASRFAISIYANVAPVELPRGTFLRTEHAANTFPALPVRTGEDVLVSFSTAESQPTLALPRIQELRLEPTRRSRIR